VDVYGIPFSLVPFKGKGKEEGQPEPPKRRVFAVPDRAHLEIKMPVVEGYTYDIRDSGIQCDVDKLEPLIVNQEPTTVWLRVPRDIEDEGFDVSHEATIQQTREEYYKATRLQQIVFRVAQQIVDDLISGASGKNAEQMRKSQLARHQVFPSVVKILNDYIERRVTFAPGVDKRELGLEKYSRMLRERVRDGILPSAAAKDSPLLPVVNTFEEYHTTASVDGVTARPIRHIKKSHLNAAVIRSMGSDKTGIGEDAVINILEDLDAVEAFAPNDRQIGFAIPYEYEGNPRRYEPDFIVRMKGGKLVILEVKGGKGEVHGEDLVNAKNTAARKWVAAVNAAGRYGTWAYEIVRDLFKVRPTLLAHAEVDAVASEGAKILPFRRVDPKPQERWVSAVPVISLRAAAGRWSGEQVVMESVVEDAEDWITFERKKGTGFQEGMYVCRVDGHSMEPEIPSGSYCLFRPVGLGTHEGKRVLVWHEGLIDGETGGMYTVKVLHHVERKVDGKKQVVTELRPLNEEFEVLRVSEGQPVRVLAELVEVIGRVEAGR
jgi:type III restriction enzyme